ncbi:ABC transporter permease [Acidobacteria bacterium AB60]|nr:ABC transporter permease [Acidobacteria bacterium AB60]
MRLEEWVYTLPLRLRTLLHRKRLSAELEEELRRHIDDQIADNISRGMGRDEARLSALRAFGNPLLLREETRATWSWNGVEQWARDLRIGVRTLRRSPGFAVTAILIMAMGIGANVALFTVIRSVLLQPLPYRDPGRLASLFEHQTHPVDAGYSNYLPVAGGNFGEWKKATRDVAQMALVSTWHQYNLSAEGGKLPEKVDAAWCSGNFFSVLGIAPTLGRVFTEDDDRRGAAAAVVISGGLWRRRYDSDPGIVGKTIWLDARPFTVIGVLPGWFVYEGKYGGGTDQLWTTASHEAPPGFMASFEERGFVAVARLLPGVTLSRLVSQVSALQKQIKRDHPEPSVSDGAQGRAMLDDAVQDYKTPLYVLLAATGCVLLIACLNVAGLLVARAAARSKEIAIRAALGGGRRRLLRERVTEGLLVSAAGGGLGLLLAWAGLQWLMSARQDMNRVASIHMDGIVALFAVTATGLCALVSGAFSVLGSNGKQILAPLQESSRSHSGGRARAGLRKTLLVLEVSLTVVLLVGAGLLVRSYQRLRSADIGVPIDNVLTMHISLPEARYRKPEDRVAFFEQLIARVRALPGVEAAGLVSTAPGEGWGGDRMMSVVEHPSQPKGGGFDILARGADPAYFTAVQVPLLSGRSFTSDERLDRAHVAILSHSAAQEMFPGEDPIGKHLHDGSDGGVFQVIGVVADTRWYVTEPSHPTLYVPIYGNDYSVATIVVRSSHDVESLATPIEKLVGKMDPDLPVSDVLTIRQAIAKTTVDSQFDSIVVLAFAVIALVLASAGLYGVLAYVVAQRTGEIGIRMALGAQRDQVLGLVLADGLRPALIGLLSGLAASAATTRFLKAMLYDTQPLDLQVFAGVTALLMASAALACLVPAWRASRLDPMQALRTE